MKLKSDSDVRRNFPGFCFLAFNTKEKKKGSDHCYHQIVLLFIPSIKKLRLLWEVIISAVTEDKIDSSYC